MEVRGGPLEAEAEVEAERELDRLGTEAMVEVEPRAREGDNVLPFVSDDKVVEEKGEDEVDENVAFMLAFPRVRSVDNAGATCGGTRAARVSVAKASSSRRLCVTE